MSLRLPPVLKILNKMRDLPEALSHDVPSEALTVQPLTKSVHLRPSGGVRNRAIADGSLNKSSRTMINLLSALNRHKKRICHVVELCKVPLDILIL